MFFPPIPLIRMKKIIKLLERNNAYSVETAKAIDEIGLINPYAFPNVLKRMINRKIIIKTNDNKYYLNKR